MFNSRLLAAAFAAAALFALGACGDNNDDNKKPAQPECTTDGDCGAGFVCSDAGTCVPETTGCNPACGEGEVCDTATNTCKPATETVCAEDSDCDIGLVCDTSVEGGACVACVGNADCGESTPVCSDNTCVVCTATEGCTEGQVCDTTVAGGACVECLGNADCGGETPVCSNNVCVGCTAAEGCGEGFVCDLESATCVPDIECNSNSDCTDASMPYCVDNFCVACLSSSDCGGTTPVCDAATNTCAGCTMDEECPVSEPICLPTGGCATRTDATSAQIEAVRGTADGAVSPALVIEHALVTYVKPTLASETGGFFVQAQPTGPAIFVESAETVSVGDEVGFEVTEVGTVNNGVRKVAALQNFNVITTGNAVGPFVQDVSNATDLVSNLMAYDSELVTATGTISGAFGNGGATHRSAQFDTAAIAGDSNLKLRIAPALETDLDLVQGCALTVTGPVWRFGSQAQLSTYSTNDLTNVVCPAATVLGAAARSPTEVVVTFDRTIDPASVVANGSQFTFTGGINATAAVASGKTVVITTTEQDSGVPYTLTVGTGLVDTTGRAVDNTNAPTFNGYLQPAKLVVNEINPNIGSTANRDLLELLVTRGGPLDGMSVVLNPAATSPVSGGTTVVTFPNMMVAAGDIIVVHISPNSSETAETVAKNEVPSTTVASYYDNAWDLPGVTNTNVFKFSGQMVVVVDPAGGIQDATPFTTNTPPGAFVTSIAAIQAAGFWLPADCGGVACTATTSKTISVDWTGLLGDGSNSVQRYAGGPDTNTKADWSTQTTATWGAPNTVTPPAP